MWDTVWLDVRHTMTWCETQYDLMWDILWLDVRHIMTWCGTQYDLMWDTSWLDVGHSMTWYETYYDLIWDEVWLDVRHIMTWCETQYGLMWDIVWHDVRHSMTWNLTQLLSITHYPLPKTFNHFTIMLQSDPFWRCVTELMASELSFESLGKVAVDEILPDQRWITTGFNQSGKIGRASCRERV